MKKSVSAKRALPFCIAARSCKLTVYLFLLALLACLRCGHLHSEYQSSAAALSWQLDGAEEIARAGYREMCFFWQREEGRDQGFAFFLHEKSVVKRHRG